MKIVHLCLSAFFIDGCSYQENILPKYHVKMGFDVTVIASLFSYGSNGKVCYLNGYSEYDDNNGFHVVRLPYKKPIKINRTFRHYEKFAEILEREKPDIIFSHNISFGDIDTLVQYLRNHKNVKIYADNHGDFINSAKNLFSKHILHPIIWRHYAKKLEPYLTKCYGVTPMRCRFLKEMYHINKSLIEFLPMGVDDESIPSDRNEIKKNIRAELNIADNDKVIFTGGKIDRLKNTHVLIAALRKLNNSSIHLIICGTLTPEMEYLQKDINEMQNVHFLGWCNSERVMNCMVSSDLACFPGTHSTLWEQAVGVSLPAIFKRWNEMEHVNVNDNCMFVQGDDETELCDKIIELLSTYDVYKTKAVEASKRFLYSEIAKKAINTV